MKKKTKFQQNVSERQRDQANHDAMLCGLQRVTYKSCLFAKISNDAPASLSSPSNTFNSSLPEINEVGREGGWGVIRVVSEASQHGNKETCQWYCSFHSIICLPQQQEEEKQLKDNSQRPKSGKLDVQSLSRILSAESTTQIKPSVASK